MSGENYMLFCQEFCGKTKSTIEDIKDHKFLEKYFNVFEYEKRNFSSGVFVIDPLGIYTPIQDNSNGIVCFKKIPFNNKIVYSFHDGNNTELMIKDNYYFLFPGVIKTDFGFKFMYNFSLFPAAGVISTENKIYFEFTEEGKKLKLTDDEIEEEFYPTDRKMILRKFDEIDDESDED